MRKLAAIILLIGGTWIAGLIWFAANMPHQREAAPIRTDAIVVLTGGTERLEMGLELLKNGYGDKLFVSGVHKAVNQSDLLGGPGGKWTSYGDKVFLGYAATDTMGNAYETAAWIRGEGLTSLTLVTAGYHMPRSLLELTYVIPDVKINTYPVFPASVKQDAWWLWPGTASLVAREYTKYLLAHLRQWLQNLAN